MLKLLLVVLVAALAAAAWFLAEPLGLPGWAPPAAVIAAITVAVLLVIHAIVRRWLDRRGARRRARDPEMVALEGYYAQELERLRVDGHELPWTVVLGPPASGKTTALLRSGLDFAESHGPRRFLTGGEVQATDRPSFFLARTAVLVDTPGRLATGEAPEDREPWRLLLRALGRGGPRRPLSAVVVVLSAPDLLSDVGVGEARLLRSRLCELQHKLGACPPVYLIITKLDAVVGLDRLLGGMPGDRLGYLIEVSGPGADASRRIAEQSLAALAIAVDRVAIASLGELPGVAERAEVLRAGTHFGELTTRIEELVACLFADHGAVDAPLWRGVFFASAGGAAAERSDPLLAALMRDLGEPPTRIAGPVPGPIRPFFLQAIFTDVLASDRWISAWSRARNRRQGWRLGLRASVVLGTCSFLLVMLVGSAYDNHRLVGEASGSIAALHHGRRGVIAHYRELAPLQGLILRLRRDAVEGPPWSARWGLYQGARLREDLLPRYRAALRERLIEPLVAEAADELGRLVRSEATPGLVTFWAGVDTLRFYLDWTVGEASERPASIRDPEWLVAETARRWGKRAGVSDDRAEAFVARALDDIIELPKDDSGLVQRAKGVLRRVKREQLWADELESGELGVAPVTLSTLTPEARWLENGGRSVAGAFTRAGWTRVHAQLANCRDRYIVAAAVVDSRSCSEEALDLRAEYFRRYVIAWNNFLHLAQVREPERGSDFHRELIQLIGQVSLVDGRGAAVNPLERLFKAVADNALLPEDPSPRGRTSGGWIGVAIDRAVDICIKQGGRDPRRATATSEATVDTVREALEPFYSYGYRADGAEAPPLFSAYAASVRPIAGQLDQYEKTRNDGDYRQAKEHAKATYNLLYDNHFPTLDPSWKPVLRQLLEPPIRALVDAGVRGERDELTQRWCTDVVAPFDVMSTCYPFSPQNHDCDASAAEVRRVFHPQTGALWALYDDALARHFPRGTNRFEVAPQGFDDRLRRNPQVADFLTHARELGEVLFPDGSEEPRFDFSIKFRPSKEANQVLLTLGGTKVEYHNNYNESFRPMSWPSEGGNEAKLEAKLKLRWDHLTGHGYWSLFKLLEQGNLHREGRMITASFRIEPARITFLIEPAMPMANPLYGTRADATLMDVFRPPRLVPPRNLFVGGKTCPKSKVAVERPSEPRESRRTRP